MEITNVACRLAKVFRFSDGFCVEVFEDGNAVEFWLYREDCDGKDLMFGVNREDVCEDNILSLAWSCVDKYADDYRASYCSEVDKKGVLTRSLCEERDVFIYTYELDEGDLVDFVLWENEDTRMNAFSLLAAGAWEKIARGSAQVKAWVGHCVFGRKMLAKDYRCLASLVASVSRLANPDGTVEEVKIRFYCSALAEKFEKDAVRVFAENRDALNDRLV